MKWHGNYQFKYSQKILWAFKNKINRLIPKTKKKNIVTILIVLAYLMTFQI